MIGVIVSMVGVVHKQVAGERTFAPTNDKVPFDAAEAAPNDML